MSCFVLISSVRLLVRAESEVATVLLGKRVNENTPEDVKRTGELEREDRGLSVDRRCGYM